MPLPLVSPVPPARTIQSSPPQQLEIHDEGEGDSDLRQHVGPYELLHELGSGSCGDVFCAVQKDSQQKVALKLMHDNPMLQALARFEREASITCSLPPSPHIVTGYDSGCVSGKRFLALELVEGESLQKKLSERGHFHWRTATQIIVQIAKALALLAEHRIVHRDVKPENIIVSERHGQPVAKLIDLGLARRLDEDEDDVGGEELAAAASGHAAPSSTPRRLKKVQTPAGCAIGSPAFMAPEQVRDSRSCSSAADAYGLGVTWYAALTGRLPFDGDSPMDVLDQVLQGNVQPPSAYADVPPAVEAMVMWLMATDAESRPSTRGPVLAQEIQRLLGTPYDGERVRRARRASHEQHRVEARHYWAHGMMVAAAVIAFIALVGRELAALAPGQEANDELQGTL